MRRSLNIIFDISIIILVLFIWLPANEGWQILSVWIWVISVFPLVTSVVWSLLSSKQLLEESVCRIWRYSVNLLKLCTPRRTQVTWKWGTPNESSPRESNIHSAASNCQNKRNVVLPHQSFKGNSLVRYTYNMQNFKYFRTPKYTTNKT